MPTIELRTVKYAGTLMCTVLLALTPTLSQQLVRTTGQTQSVVSLAPSPRPQGDSLARRAGDATFEKLPTNYHIFAAASVGEQTSVETLTLNFAAQTTLTGINMTNQNFVIVPGGSCYEGNHYAAGESCSLLVRFTPQGPGHRLGFLKVAHSAESTPASFGLVGNGYAPVINFTPAQITSVAGSVSSGTGTISTA